MGLIEIRVTLNAKLVVRIRPVLAAKLTLQYNRQIVYAILAGLCNLECEIRARIHAPIVSLLRRTASRAMVQLHKALGLVHDPQGST